MFEIGTTLRQARERRQLGLDRCEAETKIRARYLRALEDEDFDVLPGPTFVRGFLRSYAHHLGLDGQLFVDEYNSRHFDPRDDDVFPRRRPTARERRNRKRESHIILIAIVAIVALAVLVIAAASYPGNTAKEATPLPAATSAPVPTGVGNSALTVTTIAAATTATQEKSGAGHGRRRARVLRDGLRGRGHEGPGAVLRHARSRHEARSGQAAARRGRLHVRARQRRWRVVRRR